jgi:hypothetical protein
MKKIYLLLLIESSAILNTSAQTITSFTIDPLNPTSIDTVKIYVQCDFPSGGCEGATYLNGINGNVIDAGGLHCMGSLTVLCTDFDTVIVPPLAAGQYTLVFVLVTGVTAGCIPNIVPIAVDSTHIIVTSATGVYDLSDHETLQIIPNPSNGKFIVKQNGGEESSLKIFSGEGRLMKSVCLTDTETEINCFLSQGIYTIMSERRNNISFSKLVVLK